MRKKQKISLKIVILFVFFLLLLTGGLYFLLTKTGQITTDERDPFQEPVLKNIEVSFVDEDKEAEQPFDLEYITIQSKGEIYEKLLLVEGKEVKLFILKAHYGDGGERIDIDVVVAVWYGGNYENILNWWTYNLVIDRIDIDELGNDFFDVSYLESIFKEGRVWSYAYYSDYSILVSEEYLGVIEEVMEGRSFEELRGEISSGRTEGLILMPYIIYGDVE